MFWDSVLVGLKVLSYWETYVAGLMFLVIAYSPMLLLLLFHRAEMAGGCSTMLLMPLFQAFGVCVTVLTLCPIILGLSSDAAWSFPWILLFQKPLAMLILVGVLIVLSIVIAFLPDVGRSSSLNVLVCGGIVLAFVVLGIDALIPELQPQSIQIVPGFWFIVGILILSFVASYLGVLVAALVELLTRREEMTLLIGIPLGSAFAFLPVFIYGSWLALQIKANG
jgi:hypothetical protein